MATTAGAPAAPASCASRPSRSACGGDSSNPYSPAMNDSGPACSSSAGCSTSRGVKRGVGQRVRGCQVGRQLLGGDVVQHDLQPAAGLEAADQHLEAAPQRLGRLELGAVQHAAQGVGTRAASTRATRASCRLSVAGTTKGPTRRRTRSSTEASAAAASAIGARPLRRAKSDSLWPMATVPPRGAPGLGHGEGFGAGPGQDLLACAVEAGPALQVAAELHQAFQQRQCLGELVRVEVVHGGDRHLDRSFVAQGDDDAWCEAGEHVVEVVDVDLVGLSGGELGPGLHQALAGPGGEVAEDGDAEGGPGAGAGRRRVEVAEADGVGGGPLGFPLIGFGRLAQPRAG